jgi:hypothetical protein
MWFDPGLAGLFITLILLHLGEDINLLVMSLILLKRFYYLPHIILSLTWEQESIAFLEMMIVVNYLQVRICQYIIIPDDKLIGKIYLIDIESRQAHNYMLFNYDELRPLV